MTEFIGFLSELRRPKLLIRAAAEGLREYDRARDLRRVLRLAGTPAPDGALGALVAEEAGCEERRRSGDASYSFARHIEILIAMMAEARLFLRMAPSGGPAA